MTLARHFIKLLIDAKQAVTFLRVVSLPFLIIALVLALILRKLFN